MNFPLTLRIQVFSLSAKIEVGDALHHPVCFVRKNRFKFREHVTVFSSAPPRAPLCEIQAEPSPGFPIRYSFSLPRSGVLGAVARADAGGEASYVVQDERGNSVLQMLPRNFGTRSVDRVLSGIPVLRLFSGCLFRSSFSIRSPGGEEVFQLRKHAAPLESRYVLQPSGAAQPLFLTEPEELRLLMAVLMTVFLEG